MTNFNHTALHNYIKSYQIQEWNYLLKQRQQTIRAAGIQINVHFAKDDDMVGISKEGHVHDLLATPRENRSLLLKTRFNPLILAVSHGTTSSGQRDQSLLPVISS